MRHDPAPPGPREKTGKAGSDSRGELRDASEPAAPARIVRDRWTMHRPDGDGHARYAEHRPRSCRGLSGRRVRRVPARSVQRTPTRRRWHQGIPGFRHSSSSFRRQGQRRRRRIRQRALSERRRPLHLWCSRHARRVAPGVGEHHHRHRDLDGADVRGISRRRPIAQRVAAAWPTRARDPR